MQNLVHGHGVVALDGGLEGKVERRDRNTVIGVRAL